MKFLFEVGNDEKHIVTFNFNQIWGNLRIQINDHIKIKDFIIFSFSLTKAYEFQVGTHEVHKVRIEKIRKLFFAGFRKAAYKVFIDGVLAYEYIGR